MEPAVPPPVAVDATSDTRVTTGLPGSHYPRPTSRLGVRIDTFLTAVERKLVEYQRRIPRRAVLAAVGTILLVWWVSYWVRGVKDNRLGDSPLTWYSPYQFLGVDFLHNYRAARYSLFEGNPFREDFDDPVREPKVRKLVYPPIVLPCFYWCGLVGDERTAIILWMVALMGFATAGGVAAWRARKRLGLTDVPLPLVLAAVLINGPVSFAVERGNYDLLIVPLALTAAYALNRRSLAWDAAAGACLALAVGLKAYPGVLVAGLIPLRRWRALAFTLAFGAAFIAYRFDDLKVAAANLSELAYDHDPERNLAAALPDPKTRHPLPATHSITASWYTLWAHTKLRALAKIPPAVATGLIVCSMLGWVAYRLYRCPTPDPFLVPVFLWAVALGTFVPTVANDYSLVFLPMAALAVWDRRDPPAVHAALGFLLVVLQPVSFYFSPSVALGGKVAGVIAVGFCLAARLREKTPGSPPATEQSC